MPDDLVVAKKEDILNDVEAEVTATKDMKEVTVTFKSEKPLSIRDLCSELECLAHELDGIEAEKEASGVSLH